MAEPNGFWMKLVLFVVGLWTGSMEWRMRKKVNGDRIEDLKDFISKRMDSLEGRLSRIENWLFREQ
ncbi:MAG: hypothetical protein DRG36_05335 [Deltaproteobacteria bacterium]|nr:MAG: hypothetical protein DRG36_05335 [Deltaproteobacteria bacterium]